MDYVPVGDSEVLEWLNSEHSCSPEAFLADLEEQLDRGEITIDEAAAAIDDFCSNSTINCKRSNT